jgi:hypothetical protein
MMVRAKAIADIVDGIVEWASFLDVDEPVIGEDANRRQSLIISMGRNLPFGSLHDEQGVTRAGFCSDHPHEGHDVTIIIRGDENFTVNTRPLCEAAETFRERILFVDPALPGPGGSSGKLSARRYSRAKAAKAGGTLPIPL